MWVPITAYKCSVCGRCYESPPKNCICLLQATHKGELYSTLEIKEITDTAIIGVCVLCGEPKTMGSLEEEDVECPCIPPHIGIIKATKEVIKYKCLICGRDRVQVLPITTFCHECRI